MAYPYDYLYNLNRRNVAPLDLSNLQAEIPQVASTQSNWDRYLSENSGPYQVAPGDNPMGIPLGNLTASVTDMTYQDNPNYRTAPAQQPQRTLGLLGDMFGGASALDEYMTPEQKAQLQNQGILSAAMH